MLSKSVIIFCSTFLGLSSVCYSTESDNDKVKQSRQKVIAPKSDDKAPDDTKQMGQNNVKFRDVDFEAGAGDNKKNKNKNKGGGR